MAGIVVQKYGGTSVGDLDRIGEAARRVASAREGGSRVVVVVSAMGHTTDELLGLARRLNPRPPRRESDMLVATGEQVSAALLAMCLEAIGCPAVSLTGWQAGISTDGAHSSARITVIDPARILRHLDEGRVVVVAGFQGLGPGGEITTLGRGGSDATAVALAAALGADSCEIYTDVDGVYTADPRVVPGARKLDVIGYAEMMEMASLGAQVLQLRSAELARQHGVLVHVRSSLNGSPGTLVKEALSMERAVPVTGVGMDAQVAKIAVLNVQDRPGVAFRLFSAMAGRGVNVDTIIQSVNRDGVTDISFTVARDAADEALEAARSAGREIGASGVVFDPEVCKVSIVGAGVASTPGVAAAMFEALSSEGINIEMISTSEIKISCIIRAEAGPRAVRAIHDRFGLEAKVE